MRIIAGKFKGLKLYNPSSYGLRPTTDMLREALFNILGDSFLHGRVLDLFAGSGSLGIEALSRGAGAVTFIERETKSLRLLRRNLERLQEEEALIRVIPTDAFRALSGLSKKREQFDLIFVDPPYEADLWFRALSIIDKRRLLAEDGLIVLEIPKTRLLSAEVGDLELKKKKIYGEVSLEFWGYKHWSDGDEDSHLPG